MNNPLTHISLCTGIGGFDEAAEKVGFENIANCEILPKCRAYLKQRFPNAKQYTDVRNDYPKEKSLVVTFGFPCQDISLAGKGEGIFGERSKIFFDCMAVVRRIKPRYVVIENSTALLHRGMANVLAELSKSGYNAEWQSLSGSQFGFPILRKRLFIVAKSLRSGFEHPILQSPKTVGVSIQWTPSEAFLRLSVGRANGFADSTAIHRGSRVPNNNFWLHSLGNSVMPPVAEYVLKCIKMDLERK